MGKLSEEFDRWKPWYEKNYPREFIAFNDAILFEVYLSDYKKWWPKMHPNTMKICQE